MKQLLTVEDVEVVFNLAVVPATFPERPCWTIDQRGHDHRRLRATPRRLLSGSDPVLFEAYGSAQYVPMDEKHLLMPSTPYAASKIATTRFSYWKTLAAARLSCDQQLLVRGRTRSLWDHPHRYTAGAAGQPIVIYGDGEQTRDFIFAPQVADAAVRTYEEPAKARDERCLQGRKFR